MQTRLLMYTCPFSYNILTARVYLFQNAYTFGKKINILSNKYPGFKTPSPNINAIFCSLFICILLLFFCSANSSLAGAGQITSVSTSLYPSHMCIL